MNLQDYVKYLVCVILAYLQSVSGNSLILQRTERRNEVKQDRGILDLLIGRFKPCGSCVCGRSNHISRLMGGEVTDTHEYPWSVHVYMRTNHIKESGVLINDRYVLTAASPLINATAADIKVTLGEYDRCNPDVSSTNTSVETIILHPEFDVTTRARDIALIRLTRPIKFEKRISPVCLPNPGSDYLGQVGTITGWGENQIIKKCRPYKLGLPILGRKECTKSGINPDLLHNDTGCIGVIGSSPLICSNDVGTAVLYRSYSAIYDVVGIISDLNNCNGNLSTAIYTKIGRHLDWILQQTKDACYCTK